MEQSSQGCMHSKFRSLDDFKKKTHSRFADHVVFPHGKFVKQFVENLFSIIILISYNCV